MSNRNHNRGILHADFDAFFAAVEQRDFPELRNRPVVVGGSPSRRGVVASASYESRKFGIKSAMPMSTALRKCPEAVVVSPRFVVYREVSRQVMEVFRDITPSVEPLSLDEAYLDVTHLIADNISPPQIARDLKQKVWSKLGLTISVGVASSKSVAKIASDMDKPDGLTVVPPGTERAFLARLPVGSLWGVGPKTEQRLQAEGVDTILCLAGVTPGHGDKLFHVHGVIIEDRARSGLFDEFLRVYLLESDEFKLGACFEPSSVGSPKTHQLSALIVVFSRCGIWTQWLYCLLASHIGLREINSWMMAPLLLYIALSENMPYTTSGWKLAILR